MCFSFPSESRFYLKVELVYKKGIDQSLTLTNELHSIEPWTAGKELVLEMKNGVKAVLSPSFVPVPTEGMGPSDLISVEGEIYGVNSELIKEIKPQEVTLALGERKTLVFETKGGQEVEVTLTPGIE